MTEVPNSQPFEPPEPDPDLDPDALPRLLPWPTQEGKTAHLDVNGGFLAQLADEIEELQLGSAKDVVDVAHVVLDNPEAGRDELRFTAERLHESLKDTLRVALSRGLRELPLVDDEMPVLLKRWTHDPRVVGTARHEFRHVLEAWGMGELAESAELVLSELLTNSLRHAHYPVGRDIETRYERVGGGVRIEVHDANETWPELPKPSVEADFGRGLGIVDALTGARWGVSDREGVGKMVWAVVGVGDAEEVPAS